ncbi:MAG: hypothetical protein CMQ15_07095 [Gammaproteobacteria bacterium]|jgi:hypothetical protein|nr:hypothetical protein [Gammaproteobacteria bacterium]HJN95388.1 hypothetical protein [Gammaproteobacteria bacterium]|tara:strand:- start:15675 stop:16136 length:462 start_codon:yes stop_codon:yes gene_type:complete
MTTTMTLEEFSTLVDVHGSNIENWPSALRKDSKTFLESSDRARALISEQRRLEQQLDQITVPEFAGLQARILNQQLPPRNDPLLDKLLDWLIPAGGFTIQLWRPAMVACLPLVFGIVLGNYYSFGVGLQSSEVEYWEDELAMLSLSDYSESIF